VEWESGRTGKIGETPPTACVAPAQCGNGTVEMVRDVRAANLVVQKSIAEGIQLVGRSISARHRGRKRDRRRQCGTSTSVLQNFAYNTNQALMTTRSDREGHHFVGPVQTAQVIKPPTTAATTVGLVGPFSSCRKEFLGLRGVVRDCGVEVIGHAAPWTTSSATISKYCGPTRP
jgi:hypothetical protein